MPKCQAPQFSHVRLDFNENLLIAQEKKKKKKRPTCLGKELIWELKLRKTACKKWSIQKQGQITEEEYKSIAWFHRNEIRE